MNGSLRRLLYGAAWTGAALLLSGCMPAAPACRAPLSLAETGNAGCFILRQGKLLVVRDRKSGRLGFPAGTAEAGERAACTAQRETWEETGFDAEVLALLKTFRGPFFLYRCAVPAAVDPARRPRRPCGACGEIIELFWTDPFALQAHEWRFPEQFGEVQELCRAEIRSALDQ